MLQFAVAS